MGSWDATSFGNDTANDWVDDLETCDDLSFIEATFQKILDVEGDYIEAPDAEEAIAAAEVLAWLRGRPSAVDSSSEKVAAWVASHPIEPPSTIMRTALSVINRIQRKPSELPELWKGNAEWAESMADLRDRLTN